MGFTAGRAPCCAGSDLTASVFSGRSSEHSNRDASQDDPKFRGTSVAHYKICSVQLTASRTVQSKAILPYQQLCTCHMPKSSTCRASRSSRRKDAWSHYSNGPRHTELCQDYTSKMVALAEHWTNATYLKHQPFNGTPLCFWFIRPEFSSLLSEIHHDRAGLHQGFTIFVIDNSRYFIIGAYFQKFGSKLLTLCDVDCMDVVIQPTLLKHQRDFSSIRRKSCVKIYHGTVSSNSGF